jgi:S-adenosylmethionine hydrolase
MGQKRATMRAARRLEWGMSPTISLLTDFGLQDHYVGAMKGAILCVCPEATLVDLCHEIPAHDVLAGALTLDASFRFFPPGTVFLVVVDPGVGSERRPIAASADGWVFVAPDNGVLTPVLAEHPKAPVHLLAHTIFRRHPLSAVFHGRDLFGPAAAYLARGLSLSEAGPAIDDPVRLSLPGARTTADGAIEGTVLRVDRFGNLTTSVRAEDVATLVAEGVEVVVAGQSLPLVRTYADVPEGRSCALVGSSGRLEVAVNQGRAHETLGVERGGRVLVRRRPPA